MSPQLRVKQKLGKIIVTLKKSLMQYSLVKKTNKPKQKKNYSCKNYYFPVNYYDLYAIGSYIVLLSRL